MSVSCEAGKRVRRSFYGRTRADVAIQMTEALKNLTVGRPPTNERETVGQCLASWLADIHPAVRPSTWLRYRQIVETHLVPSWARSGWRVSPHRR